MKFYNKSTSFQRFGAFLIDTLIVGIFTVGFSAIILYAIDFSFSSYMSVQNEFVTDYLLYLQYGGEYEKSYIAAINEYYRYSLQFYLVFDSVALVVFIGYLVVLPLLWSKQTVGRMALRIKVIGHMGEVNVSYKRIIVREILGTWFIYVVLYAVTGGIVIIISAIVAGLTGRSFVDRISGTDLVFDTPIEVDKEAFESAFRFDSEEAPQFKPSETAKRRPGSIDAEVKDVDDKESKENDNDSNLENDSYDKNDSDDDEYQIF